MFDHFVESGLLSQEDVETYRHACQIRSNMQIDTEKEYLSTFWESSVLVCDFSSIVIEYFVTLKPIIYLTYSKKIAYTDQMQAMLRGCYIVDNADELQHILDNLQRGEDPLAKVRKEVCETVLLGNENITASENMKNVLLDGYKK